MTKRSESSAPFSSGSPRQGSAHANAAAHGRSPWPGLLLVLAISVACVVFFRPPVSPALVTMVLGFLAGALGVRRSIFGAGTVMAGRTLLRLGVVLLGLKFSLSALATLGWGVVLLAMVIVFGGLAFTWWLGRLMGLSQHQAVLMASGFSICGAAAVAGVQQGIKGKDEDAAGAIAVLSVYGMILVPVLPWLAHVLGLGEVASAVWAGASLHEVGHVVAAAGLIGSGAVSLAVAVKLLRVLLLGPVVIGMETIKRRRPGIFGEVSAGGKRPPLVPWFVLGFIACAALAALVPLPAPVLGTADFSQQVLLAAGMFGLGTGVSVPALLRQGWKLPVLGLLSTLAVMGVGLLGAVLIG